MAEHEKIDLEATRDSAEVLDLTLGVVCPVCGLEVTGGFICCPNDGTKLIPDPSSDSALSDKYDSLELIGEGGMSAIYKARHRLMKRTVAIKLLHSHFHKSPDTIKRFQQEAEAISAMSHENVVNVFDFGQLKHGQPYMVMNYVAGQSLSQLIKLEGPLALKRALKLFIQISQGLSHAHQKHIVHRDLKPTNIMLTLDESGRERAVIVDFGIAKIMTEGERGMTELTKTGAVIGSPHYMSPEQCLGRQIDSRSDIYSFGCLIYETLAGKPMFAGDSALETMHKQVTEKAPALPSLPSLSSLTSSAALNACVQAIVNHAVEKDSSKRYQTVSELSQDLILLDNFLEKGLAPKLSALNACSPKSLKPIPLAAISIGIMLCLTQMYFWFNHPVDRNLLSLRSGSAEPSNSIEGKIQRANRVKPSADIYDDNSLAEFVKTHPKVTELKASGITSKGMPALKTMTNLKKLELDRCTADDTALKSLGRLQHLESLILKDAKLNDKGMKVFSELTSLRSIFVQGNGLTDACFDDLAKLQNLSELSVENIEIMGAGISRLAALPHLTKLVLMHSSGGTKIGNDDLKRIAEILPNLQVLKLEGARIDDQGLRYLQAFHRLDHLSLAFSPRISDLGMIELAKLHLKWLNLNGTDITNKGLASLANMQGLEQIFFWHTNITDEGMVYLNKLKSLRVLHLTYTAVGDKGLAELKNLTNLIDLKLRQTQITNDSLRLIENFPHLEWLNLQETDVTDAGLKYLENISSLKEIDLTQTDISDSGLKSLMKMKTLQAIYLKDCKDISAEGLAALRRALPNCNVSTAQQMRSRAFD